MASLSKEEHGEVEAGSGSPLSSIVLTEEHLQALSSLLKRVESPKLVIEYKDDHFLSLGQGPMPLPTGKI